MNDDWDDSCGGQVHVEQRVFSNSNWRDRNNDQRGGNRYDRNRRDDGNNQQRRPPRQQFDDNATTIKIPSKMVGRVIGRGGCKINDLQFESGAKINVTKETDGDQTIVRISGDESQVDSARKMIEELTIEREPRSYQYESQSETPKELDQPSGPIDWQTLFQESERAANAAWDKLPKIQKEFYTEHPEITALSSAQVAAIREENNNIVVARTFKSENSRPIPNPVISFEHAFHQYPAILEEIKKAGFTKPSPIQCQAWPVLLSGEDLIGIAQTGTGKTLAFLLPALIHIDGQLSNREERGGPAVLIMAPTRELALQIDKEVGKYEYKGITSICIYGGSNRRDQIAKLSGGIDIVIATPGRLNDLIEAGHLDIKYVTYAVLDEADRMLDMGFEPQIRKVMYAIRPTRQTVMTSATWPPGVRRLAESYMSDPIQIYVGTLDLAATHTVSQIIEMLPDDDDEKYKKFMEFVQNLAPDDKVIVFCGKKARADGLSTELSLAGHACQCLHGDRDQSDREQALRDIKSGAVQILIATDVASRGLDIDDITHVINYDFPRNIEEYVHRVGRTGRAGKTGQSISYFTRGDWAQAKELINILEEAQQYVPEEIHQMAERHAAWKERKDNDEKRYGGRRGGGGGGGGGGGRRW